MENITKVLKTNILVKTNFPISSADEQNGYVGQPTRLNQPSTGNHSKPSWGFFSADLLLFVCDDYEIRLRCLYLRASSH